MIEPRGPVGSANDPDSPMPARHPPTPAQSAPSSAESRSAADLVTGVAAVDEKVAGFIKRLARDIDVASKSNPFRGLTGRIVLASGARTGSHLLCEKLQHHGVNIKELFNTERILTLCTRHGLTTISEYCEYAIQKFSSDGVFAAKGGPSAIAPMLLAGELPPFAGEWGWVYLKREDVVKQAVSNSIARKSGAFRSVGEGREVSDDEYSGDEILEIAIKHDPANEIWEELFTALSVTPCRLTYEQLAADPEGVAASVAEQVGLHGPPVPRLKPPERALQKQANALNSLWEARFLEERPEFRRGAE